MASSLARRYSSSYVQRDSKKRNFNPLLPPRYNPQKNKPPPTNTPPKQPILSEQHDLADNFTPPENNTYNTQPQETNTTQTENNFQTKQNNDTIRSPKDNKKQQETTNTTQLENTFQTKYHEFIPKNKEYEVKKPPELVDEVSFEDKEDLEPSICQCILLHYIFLLLRSFFFNLNLHHLTHPHSLPPPPYPIHLHLRLLLVIVFTAFGSTSPIFSSLLDIFLFRA